MVNFRGFPIFHTVFKGRNIKWSHLQPLILNKLNLWGPGLCSTPAKGPFVSQLSFSFSLRIGTATQLQITHFPSIFAEKRKLMFYTFHGLYAITWSTFTCYLLKSCFLRETERWSLVIATCTDTRSIYTNSVQVLEYSQIPISSSVFCLLPKSSS